MIADALQQLQEGNVRSVASGETHIVYNFTVQPFKSKLLLRVTKDLTKGPARLEHEAEIYKHLNGKSLSQPQFPHYYWSRGGKMIVERIDGKSLHNVLEENKVSLDRIAVEIVDILHEMRIRSVAHCDFHSKNILVQTDKHHFVQRVVVIDFDMAHIVQNAEQLAVLNLSDALCIILNAMRYGVVLWRVIAYARNIITEFVDVESARSKKTFIAKKKQFQAFLLDQVIQVKSIADKVFLTKVDIVEWLFDTAAIEGMAMAIARDRRKWDSFLLKPQSMSFYNCLLQMIEEGSQQASAALQTFL